MSKTITFTVPVEVEVDLDDWCTAYGMTEEVARRDAEEHSKGTIAEAVHEALERVANGSSLVGDLSSYLPEPPPKCAACGMPEDHRIHSENSAGIYGRNSYHPFAATRADFEAWKAEA